LIEGFTETREDLLSTSFRLNSSNKVKSSSFAYLGGVFDTFEVSFENHPSRDKIERKENQPDTTWSCVDLAKLDLALDGHTYLGKRRAPIFINVCGDDLVIDRFKSDPEAVRAREKIRPQFAALMDYVLLLSSRYLSKRFDGEVSQIRTYAHKTTGKKAKYKQLVFLNGEIDYLLMYSIRMPILSAYRQLVRLGENGQDLEFIMPFEDVKEFVDKTLQSLLDYALLKITGKQNTYAFGRTESIWNKLYDMVEKSVPRTEEITKVRVSVKNKKGVTQTNEYGAVTHNIRSEVRSSPNS
jgi:6-pyruvoyl-tetrahydropterin synthase